MSSSYTRKKPLTERFVVEDEFDPRGNIGEDVESKEEDEGDRGNLIGKTHLQSWSSLLVSVLDGGGISKAQGPYTVLGLGDLVGERS